MMTPGRAVFQHDVLWRATLQYEVRSILKNTSDREDVIVCGDKSGILTCVDSRGVCRWTDGTGRSGGGPVYALQAVRTPQTRRRSAPNVLVVGTGRGTLRCHDITDGRPLALRDADGTVPEIRFAHTIMAGAASPLQPRFWLAFADGAVALYRLTRQDDVVTVTREDESQCGSRVTSLDVLPDSPRHRATIAGTALGQLVISRATNGANPPVLSIPLTAQGAVRSVAFVGRLADQGHAVAVSLDDALAVLVVRNGIVEHRTWISFGSRINCIRAAAVGDRVWILAGTRAGQVHVLTAPAPSDLRCTQTEAVERWLTRLLGRPMLSAQFDSSVLRLVPLVCGEQDLTFCLGLGNHEVLSVGVRSPAEFKRALVSRPTTPVESTGPAAAADGGLTLASIAAELRSATPLSEAGQRNRALLFKTDWLIEYAAAGWTVDDNAYLEMIVYGFLDHAQLGAIAEMSRRLVELGRQCPAASATAVALTSHIDKYCLDGDSFSAKTIGLDRLAAANEANGGPYLYDAAIYRQLIAERRCVLSHSHHLESPVTQVATASTSDGEIALAVTYWTGEFALFTETASPPDRLALKDGDHAARWVQQVLIHGDPKNHWLWLVAFYRDRGWSFTRYGKEPLGATAVLSPPSDRLINAELAFVYSSIRVGDSRYVLGGRWGDIFLVRLVASADGLDIELLGHKWLLSPDPASYNPVWSLAAAAADGTTIIAGCGTGDSFRVTIEGDGFGEAVPVWRTAAAIQAIAVDGSGGVVLGDALGNVTLLQPLAGDPGAWGVAWGIRLPGAIEGIVRFAWHPRTVPDDEDRPMLAVSDSMGEVHLLRTDLFAHSYAIKVCPPGVSVGPLTLRDGGRGSATSSPEIVAGGADGHVRTIRLEHRRDSLAKALEDIATLAVEHAAPAMTLSADEKPQLRHELASALERADEFLSETLDAIEGRHPVNGPLLRPALEHVAWKLASCVPGKSIPQALVTRLQFDNPGSLAAVIEELRELARPDGVRDRHRLRTLLRIGCKIASRMAQVDASEGATHEPIVKLVAIVNQLADVWGTPDSDDNLICRLYIFKYVCRYATAASLTLFFGPNIEPQVRVTRSRTMSQFVSQRLLSGFRTSGRRRTLQYLRRMVLRDRGHALKAAVSDYLLPILVGRLQAQEAFKDGWLGIEYFLCFHAIHTHYKVPFLAILDQLMEVRCGRGMMQFIATSYGVRPPEDKVAGWVAKGLSLVQLVTDESHVAARSREALSDILSERLSAPPTHPGDVNLWCLNVGIAATVGIAFGPSHSEDRQRKAQEFLQHLAESPKLAPADDKAKIAVQCVASLTRRTTDETSRKREIREARRSLQAEAAAGYRDDLPDDIVASALNDAIRCVSRRLEIEADFVAPVRFLKRFDQPDESSWREQQFADELRDYARFLCEIGTATKAFSITIPSKKTEVLLDQATEDGSERFNEPPKAAVSRVRAFLGEEVEALENLFAQGTRKFKRRANDEPVQLKSSRGLLEIVQVEASPTETSGILGFVYDARYVLDPAQRAVARIIPNLILSEFRRATQARQLLSVTFHHINAPIVAARQMITDLQAGYIDQRQMKMYFDEMARALEDCRAMVSLHQNYVRVMRGIRPPLTVTSFDAIGEIEFRRRMIGFRYKANRHTLRMLHTDKSVAVALDRVLFGDIVQNLLDNACKYSPAGSEVTVAVRTGRRELFVEVSDTGPGLPPGVWQSMFEEGVRGPRTLGAEGLGLGLFMVNEYVRQLGGEIWPASSSDGTTFTVKLPLRMERA